MIDFPTTLLSEEFIISLPDSEETITVSLVSGSCHAALHKGKDLQIILAYILEWKLEPGIGSYPSKLVFCYGCHAIHYDWPEGAPPMPESIVRWKAGRNSGRTGVVSEETSEAARHSVIQKGKEYKQKKKICVLNLCREKGTRQISGLWVCDNPAHIAALENL